mmetsp:Transcript_109647/g.340299  ORF Transcript_109647/g.340299 Transcript_109647/m.340299 type:complete len:677 (+) Transcript_109647:253-2283(+)
MRLLLVLVSAATATAASAARTVVLGHDGRADALDLLVLLFDLLRICLWVRVHPRLAVLERIHDLFLLVSVHLLAEALVLAGAFGRGAHGVDVAVERILRVDPLLDLLVLVRVLLGLLDHLLDLLLGQAALVVCDRDLLALACALVLRADVQDAVRVDLEGHLDLRLAARRRRDPAQLELAEEVVVLGHGPLSLVDLDVHGRLVVLVRREDLRLLGRDDGVAADELRHDSADRLDAERERRHIEQQQVLAALAAQDPRLHRGAVGDCLVRVDAAVRLLSVEEVLDQLLDLGDARRAADKHDLVDLVLLQAGVLEDLLHRPERVLEQVVVDLLETCAREGLREVDAVVQGLDLNAALVRGAQGALRLLDLAPQLLDRPLVLGHVLPVLLLEDLHEVLHHALVEVLSAQVGVAVRGDHLEDAVVDGQQRDVKGAAPEVVDEDVLLGLLVKTIGNGGCGRLVDDSQHVEASDGAGILRGLPLRIVEVSGNGDNGMLHLLAQVVLGGLLHLGQNHGGDLLWCHHLVLALDLHRDHRLPALLGDQERQQLDVLLDGRVLEPAPNQALDIEESLRGVDGRLVLRCLADQALLIREGNVRRRDPVPLVIRDDLNAPVLVNADARVGCAQVDSDDWPIDLLLLCVLRTCEAHRYCQAAQSCPSPHHGRGVPQHRSGTDPWKTKMA